jgi:hypothetical protein
MSKDAHGWQFFNKFYEKDFVGDSFKVMHRQDNGGVPGKVLSFTDTYQPLYVECTDYNNATDLLQHEVAELIAVEWMSKCGIPPLLQDVVVETCFRPRDVFFNGSDGYWSIGELTDPLGTQRKVVLETGVLMGDPLTKVILHLVNIITRRIGGIITDKSVQSLIPSFELKYPKDERPRKEVTFSEVKKLFSVKEVDTVFEAKVMATMSPVLSRVVESDRSITGGFGFLPGVHRFTMKNGYLDMETIPFKDRDPKQLRKVTTDWYFLGKTYKVRLDGLPPHVRNPPDPVGMIDLNVPKGW